MPISNDVFLKGNFVDNDINELLGSSIEVSTYALSIIKKRYSKIMNITPNHSIVFKGDFYSLLSRYNIPSSVHYVTALLNGYKTSTDFKEELSKIHVIDPTFLDKIETLILNEKKEHIMTI